MLSDVRETVEDWDKMRDAALRIADDLPGEPLDALADEEVNEARELLRWLAADHFTFLGYREYELRRPTHWLPSPAPASASCVPTRTTARTRRTRSARPSTGCPPTPAPRPVSASCSS